VSKKSLAVALPSSTAEWSRLETTLFDAAGKEIESLKMSVPAALPVQWGIVPSEAYLGFKVGSLTPVTPKEKTGQLVVPPLVWNLNPGTYVLRAKLIAKEGPSLEEALTAGSRKGQTVLLLPPNQWVGELDLPPVEIVVAKEQAEK
jgi:hypothetical protein